MHTSYTYTHTQGLECVRCDREMGRQSQEKTPLMLISLLGHFDLLSDTVLSKGMDGRDKH